MIYTMKYPKLVASYQVEKSIRELHILLKCFTRKTCVIRKSMYMSAEANVAFPK